MYKLNVALLLVVSTLLSFAKVCFASEGLESTRFDQRQEKEVDIDQLFSHWVHSREEQKDQNGPVRIFRPAGSRKFPPSRFRMAYKFSREDKDALKGKCEWMFLSPVDGHHFKAGKWAIDEMDKSQLTITTDKEEHYRIVELTKDILRLETVKPK